MKKRDVVVFVMMCLYLCMLPMVLKAKLSSHQSIDRKREFETIAVPTIKGFNSVCTNELFDKAEQCSENRKWVYLDVNCI